MGAGHKGRNENSDFLVNWNLAIKEKRYQKVDGLSLVVPGTGHSAFSVTTGGPGVPRFLKWAGRCGR